MTALIALTPRPPVASPMRFDPAALYRRMLQDDPTLTVTGALITLLAVPTALALALDARMLDGEPIWLKPLKFELSVGLFLLTLAFFARFVAAPVRQHAGFRAFGAVVAFSAITEIVWIGGAAALGTRSHYNDSFAYAETLYGIMGVFALVLTSGALVYGIAIWRNTGAVLTAGMRTAIALSLVLTFALTVPVAMTLADMTALVGGPKMGVTVPILGWSREVGDLRVAHFFGTHAMHAIPLVALALAGAMTVARAWGLAVAYAALTVAVFVQALMGLPLFPL